MPRLFAFLRLSSAALLILLITPAALHAQGAMPWVFRTRLVLSGSSDHSDPEGYQVYSGISLEAGIARTIARRFALELSARTESREVDRTTVEGDEALGSVELLPVTATLTFRPTVGQTVHPYLGAGAALAVTWEKAGQLNSLDVPAHFGPAVQAGIDVDLGGRAVLNLDVRWNTLRLDVQSNQARIVDLKVDPLSFGIGIGFRF